MSCCPTCGGTGKISDTLSTPGLLDQLRAACLARGTWISPDERVREADAAELIGWQPKTLRNRRYADAPIPFVMRGGRPLYALADLAAFSAEA